MRQIYIYGVFKKMHNPSNTNLLRHFWGMIYRAVSVPLISVHVKVVDHGNSALYDRNPHPHLSIFEDNFGAI